MNFDPRETRSMYFDIDGNAIGLFEWARLLEQRDYKRIAASVLGDNEQRCEVSTVWLGLDQSVFGGPPLIFETMIFGDLDAEIRSIVDIDECELWRYSTRHAALAGHDQIVAALRERMKQRR